VIVLILPFLANDAKRFIAGVKNYFSSGRIVFTSLILIAGISFIQCMVYYLESGKFIVNAYSTDHFDFLHPAMTDILFSFRKGLFVYTPFVFLSLFAVISIIRENIFRGVMCIIFFLAIVYSISSWECWWYGGSYGLRAFIEFYPVFAILAGIILQNLRPKGLRYFFMLLFAFTLYLNTTQAFQYRHSIIPGDGMTKEKYMEIFLKTKRKYWGYIDKEQYDYSPSNIIKKTKMFYNYESKTGLKDTDGFTDERAHSGNFSDKISGTDMYSFVLNLKIPADEIVVIKTDFWAYYPRTNCDALLVFSFEKADHTIINWSAYSLKEYDGEPRNWTEYDFEVRVPETKRQDDIMKIFFWTPNGYTAFIDDWNIEVYELKK
jgi:hypothetical protein